MALKTLISPLLNSRVPPYKSKYVLVLLYGRDECWALLFCPGEMGSTHTCAHQCECLGSLSLTLSLAIRIRLVGQ